jgi:cell division septal protein FtsQ
MQLHINRPGKDEPHRGGYAPAHSAKPLDEFDEILREETLPDEDFLYEDEQVGWRSSRRIAVATFIGAIILVGVIIYFASDFSSSEKLDAIRVVGNRAILTSEIYGLASINKKETFYTIDLQQIEKKVQKHPLVRNVTIRRETNPNTIVISVTEREAIALIRTSNGEPALIDNEHTLFWPRRMTGLKNPDRLMKVPVLSGISEKDTASLNEMALLVETLSVLSDSAMYGDIGELKKTPTGGYVIYTNETLTPIFLGEIQDKKFETALDRERNISSEQDTTTHFNKQLALLASLWKKRLKNELRVSRAAYLDARFHGQIIVKHKT